MSETRKFPHSDTNYLWIAGDKAQQVAGVVSSITGVDIIISHGCTKGKERQDQR